MEPLNIALVAILLSCCHADIYMHNPRGTNNRLNERSAQRKNANRLFDSQVQIVHKVVLLLQYLKAVLVIITSQNEVLYGFNDLELRE